MVKQIGTTEDNYEFKPDSSKKFKKGVVTDLATNNPILKMNSEKDYSYFFKNADKENVQALFNYFKDNRFDVYLSGGAATSAMLTGKPNYTDIDMLIVSEEQNMLDMSRLLTKCHPNFPKNLDDIARFPGAYILNANGKLFQTVAATTLQKMYLSSMVEERFALIPVTPVSSYSDDVSRQSVIDLSLMTDILFADRYNNNK
jgi:hypothetical protein